MVATPAFAARDLTKDDLNWLNRVTYGVNTTVVAEYRDEGRSRFLRHQLDTPAKLPAIQQQITLSRFPPDGASLAPPSGRRTEAYQHAGLMRAARDRTCKALNDRQRARDRPRRELLRDLLLHAATQNSSRGSG